MTIGPPVRGVIHPNDWKRPAGNTDWRVTQEFGCTGVEQEPRLGDCLHFHRGIDLGNGKCGSDAIAVAAGRVAFSGLRDLEGNTVVIDHGSGLRSGYAHLASRTVATGTQVTRGQKIGAVGDTGAAIGCHLHFSVKDRMTVGDSFWTDATGRWLDPWKLLTPEDDMPPLNAYIPGHTATIGKGFNVRSSPQTADNILRTTLAPEEWAVFGWAKGEVVGNEDDWLVRWAGRYEYVHRSGVTGLRPPSTDCTAAVKAATDPLQAKLNTATTELSQAKARISAATAALTQ